MSINSLVKGALSKVNKSSYTWYIHLPHPVYLVREVKGDELIRHAELLVQVR